MSGLVLAAMPRVTRRYDNAAGGSPQPSVERSSTASVHSASTPITAASAACAAAAGGGYAPITATDPALRPVTFTWARACGVYSLNGPTAVHAGGAQLMNRPVVGTLAMPPATGKYFYQVRIHSASSRVGVATASAYPDGELAACELGHLPPSVGEAPVVAVLDGQTSRVLVNGQSVGHLWRLFVPSCGALFSFVVDTDTGVVQLFVDKKYAGIIFDASAGLMGKTLYPVVSIAGLDMHNRGIGSGNISAVVSPASKFDCLY